MSIVLTRSAVVSNPDYTSFSGYVDSQGLIYHREGSTVPVPLRPTRQDVGQNENEVRPESGDIFSQGSFIGGAGQSFYHHHPGDNSAKTRFFSSEGANVSRDGRVTNLWAGEEVDAPSGSSAGHGRFAMADDALFLSTGGGGNNGEIITSTDGETWTTEDPMAGEGAQPRHDIASSGDELYTAHGSAGIHVRDSAGTYTHYSDVAATRLCWVKRSRLMASDGTSIYEVIASGAAPAAIETLESGWLFTDIFDAGNFIYACAVSTNSARSRLHIYGLNSAGTAIEAKGSQPMTTNEVIHTGISTSGVVFLGGGRANRAAITGYQPILYQATQDDDGFLTLDLRREADEFEDYSYQNDLSVKALAAHGSKVYFGWTNKDSDAAGNDGDNNRRGVAVYDVARGSFANHLEYEGAVGADVTPLAVTVFKNHVLYYLGGVSLQRENIGTYKTTAEVVTSTADWQNAGNKLWAWIEIAHDPQPASTSIKVEYSTKPSDEAEWTTAGTSSTLNSTGALYRLTTNVESRYLALRFTLTATSSAAPVLRSFSVRSDPKPSTPEWRLTRYPRFMHGDRLNTQGEVQWWNPRTTYDSIRDKIGQWVTWTEPGETYTALLKSVAAMRPDNPVYSETTGEEVKDVIYAEVVLEGILK